MMLRLWLRLLAAALALSPAAEGLAAASSGPPVERSARRAAAANREGRPPQTLKSLALPPATGQLSVLTYNVAGLPAGFSKSKPVANLPLIGSLLNGYDLALVQEDFAYPFALRERIQLPYASSPAPRGEELPYGDGLSLFSRLRFGTVGREGWRRCHGVIDSAFDCLAKKGFTFADLELAPGVGIDVYNLHMDAGRSRADHAARVAQLEQLAKRIRRHSRGRAVIVAGDFNLGASEQEALAALRSSLGLRDACAELGCPRPANADRVLWRSSRELKLIAVAWRIDGRFVDDAHRPLSDHQAVAVDFGWRTNGHLSTAIRR